MQQIPPALGAVLEGEPLAQQAFPWVPAGWGVAPHDCPTVLALLEKLPARIDRNDVCSVVTENLARNDALSALVPAMT